MRATPLLLLTLAACAVETKVITADAETLANKRLHIAVLDPFDGSGTQDPAVLQLEVRQALHEAGYRRAETSARRTQRAAWNAETAAASARSHGAQAAFVVEIETLRGQAPERRDPAGGIYTTPGDDSGTRRDYYVEDLEEPRPAGPTIRAVARILDAQTARVLYAVEIRVPAGDLSEAGLAAALVAPLEEY